MPINRCSINSFTIDALRCRRAHVQPTIGKAHPYHTRVDPRTWQEPEEIDVRQLEGPNIRLTITLNGESFSETYDNPMHEIIPLVTLSSLSINSIDDLPTISISNLNINTQ